MTHAEKIEWMRRWAERNGLRLELEGECGIGRECVGVTNGSGYPEYSWYDDNYEREDKNGDVWNPPDAYHKHPCVAVLGRGEKAESQLHEWLVWFEANGFVVESGRKQNPYGFVGVLLVHDRFLRLVRGEKKS